MNPFEADNFEADGFAESVAIIGMAGRFPGAGDVGHFWRNLEAGVESIQTLSEAQLLAEGIDAALLANPDYVRARGLLDGVDQFDPAFFGYAPAEAALIDPQHRILLECAYEALENAGCDPERFQGPIGVYAGQSLNTYLLYYLCPDRTALEELTSAYQVGQFPILTGNDKDYLASRISYKLNLRGPSIAVQTACSTSLVAVSQAVQSLLTYQCDLALAGGVAVAFPQHRGYLYQEGGIGSPDGRCRAFDARSAGTVFGAGCGLVVLKRLSEAIADGDRIDAVIRGAAINNDGAAKASFSAPSSEGQAEVIALAQALAGVSPESISYVEAHGTGTPLGDPIEVEGLTRAFRAATDRKQFCVLSSVKPNVGHLESASGVTGLIKTTLALKHRRLPGTLHFEQPNPRIDFSNSPFRVTAHSSDWPEGATPRRAGVSSFGVGGTNAHVVLEEAPPPPMPSASKPDHLLVLSAKTRTALDRMTANLAKCLREQPEIGLADAAYTLQVGRKLFAHRRAVICGNRAEAIAALDASAAGIPKDPPPPKVNPQVAFLFPGQGAQQVDMARALYAHEPVFREIFEAGCKVLTPLLGVDPSSVLYPCLAQEYIPTAERPDSRLQQTRFTQPLLFLVEYALARLWMHWGIQPTAMIGHSLGEYTAACLTGVFTLEDGLRLLAERGKLIETLPNGAMLAVGLSEADLRPLLSPHVALAAVNAPELCTVSGDVAEIAALEQAMEARGTACRPLETSRAFHSAMMDPILGAYRSLVQQTSLHAPQIPYVSNLTGRWITPAEATDPSYWVSHLRETVRFGEGMVTLLETPVAALLEVGPGNTLTAMARRSAARSKSHALIVSLPPSSHKSQAEITPTDALGALWLAGAQIDWKAYHAPALRRRVGLPTYPFERVRCWVDLPERLPKPAFANTDSAFLSLSPLAERFQTQAPLLSDNDLTSPQLIATSLTPAWGRSEGREDRTLEIEEALISALHTMTGIEREEIDPTLAFLELGLDSLFLTQASRKFQNTFQVPITFRHLMADYPTIRELAGYVEGRLPVRPTPTPQTVTLPLEGRVAASPALSSGADSAPCAVAPGAVGHGPFRPPQKSLPAELTPRQQQHLDVLIARYMAKTPLSKEQTRRFRPRLADPRVVSGFRAVWKEMVYPIVAARSEGSRIWDVDGNEFIDVTMGFGVNLFGHSPPFITEAVERQLRLGVEIGPQSPLAGEVAERVCTMTGMERATLCNTGSEAVMVAMRLARTVTGRDKIAIFTGDYHGTFDEVLVRGNNRNGTLRTLPIAPGIPQASVENVLVLDYGAPESLDILRMYAHELAAVMVEPVQSRCPDLQPAEFLHAVRAITEQSGAALIFDEVITGFRCHPGGAQAHFGIRADLATYGKIVGGGMPIGVVAGSAEYMDALDGGPWEYGDASFPEVGVTFFAGTFVRHPLALAAAVAALERLQEAGPALQEQLNRRTALFADTLNAEFAEQGLPLRIPYFASNCYLRFAPEWHWGSLLFFHMREKGLHIWEGRPFFLSTAHSDADIAFMLRVFRESLTEMRAGGFLSETKSESDGLRLLHAASAAESAANVLESAQAPPPLPLTEPQKEIWLACQMGEAASCAFNESLTLHLRGALDLTALHEALQYLVGRHEALRATFDASGTHQHLAPTCPLDIPLVDFTACAEAERTTAVETLLTAEGRRPFDLEAGPLFRVQIVRLAQDHHLCVLTAHHLVCDGWSFGILLSELSTLYSGARIGQSPSLEPAVGYREYVCQQEAQRGTEQTAEQEAYWMAQLAEPLPVLDLPLDRMRPAEKGYLGARTTHRIDASLLKALRQLSARSRTTLVATLLSAFTALLQRLTNQEDLILGIPAAGQSRLSNPNLVGHCVHLLPLRLAGTPDRPFTAQLAVNQQQMLDAYDHQDCTFSTLLPRLAISRNRAQSPLVSVTFNMDRPFEGIDFAGLSAEVTNNPRSHFQFDLGLNIVDSGEELEVECDYDSELFEAATITRWLQHYETLLRGVVEEPTQQVSLLPLLTSAERYQILEAWNDTRQLAAQNLCLHEHFEAQAAHTPDAIAAIWEAQQLTYRELDQQANRLAHHLRKLGVGPEVLVGLCLERSLEMLVGVLGILKAGGAYVPLDPHYPAQRLTYLLENSQAAVLLTQESLRAMLPLFAGPLVCMESVRALPILSDASRSFPVEAREAHSPSVEKSEARPIPRSRPDSLAYLIYTSGSTGNPKGVAIEHRSASALIEWAKQMYSPEDLAGVLFSTSLCFDLSVFELFVTLSSGGTVIVAQNGLQLPMLPAREQVTLINTVPSVMMELLRIGCLPASVRTVNLAGEPLPTSLVNQVYLQSHVTRVFDLYGPSEDTTYSTAILRRPDALASIGRPIANTRAYILDAQLQPLPVGVPGELCLAGDGLARGYLNQPEETCAKFVADTFSPVRGARLYRTGDRAKYLPDGNIVFLGRQDHQVKLRGFRIELGEVESALSRIPGMTRSVAVVQADIRGDRHLVAYLVAQTGENLVPSDLRRLLRETLPEYMIPTFFLFLEDLPLTATGKVDRRALPPLSQEILLESIASRLLPADDLEARLTEIWKECLGIHSLGREDDFFEMGGHSMLGIRLILAVEKSLGTRLPLPCLFQAPTIAAMAQLLRQRSGENTFPDPDPAGSTQVAASSPVVDAALSEKPMVTPVLRQETATMRRLIVPLQPNGSRVPLFCVHHIFGTVFCYRNLVRRLHPDQPVYGLQGHGIDDQERPELTIQEIAADCVAAARLICPNGPFLLCGLSSGGVVAYEMAQQLHAQGLQVAMVGLFDTYSPRYFVLQQAGPHIVEDYRRGLTTRMLDRMRLLHHLDSDRKGRYLSTLPKSLFQSLQNRLSGRKPEEEGITSELLHRLAYANFDALCHYEPSITTVPVTLFRAIEQVDMTERDPQLWWGETTGNQMKVREVFGNHFSLLYEPFVWDLADQITQEIEEATRPIRNASAAFAGNGSVQNAPASRKP